MRFLDLAEIILTFLAFSKHDNANVGAAVGLDEGVIPVGLVDEGEVEVGGADVEVGAKVTGAAEGDVVTGDAEGDAVTGAAEGDEVTGTEEVGVAVVGNGDGGAAASTNSHSWL